jgi:hypothetical protein
MSTEAISSAAERYHAAEADHAEARREQEISRRLARHARKRAASARSTKLEALITLAMTPAESLDNVIGKAGLVREALGDERALAARIVRAEGMPAADRLALAVVLDLLQLEARS